MSSFAPTHSISQPQNLSYDHHLHYNQMYPDFSTQCSVDGLDAATEEAPKKPSRQKRDKWSIDDDKVLVSAYLNTSKDAIIGTDQSAACFWKKIAMYYNEFKKGVANRDAKSCKNRWHTVNGQVQKFVGAYNHASLRKKSGESENDVLVEAHKIYEADMSKIFNLEHAWYMLKSDPKWMAFGEGSSSKRTKINERGNYSSSSSAGTPATPTTPCTPGTTSTPDTLNFEGDYASDVPILIRPIGVKAAKRKAKANMNHMPSVEEGTTERVANEANRQGLMNEFLTMQNRMVDAMADKTRTKKIGIYSKLAAKANLSEHEERLLVRLEEELYPKNV